MFENLENRRHLPSQPFFQVAVLGLSLVLLVACQKSSQEHLANARDQLAKGAYSQAIEAAGSGLAANPEKATAWGLELVALEAYARGGQGAEAVSQIEIMAERFPAQLTATEYASTTQQLREAEQGAAAIQVLDMAANRYPDDLTIKEMVKDSVKCDVSPEELKQLEALGYLDTSSGDCAKVKDGASSSTE